MSPVCSRLEHLDQPVLMFHSRKLILSGALQVFLIFVEQLKHAPLAGSKHPAVFFSPHTFADV